MQSNRYRTALGRAKLRARQIRAEKALSGETISHAQALELVARELGHRDWNTASARLSNHPDIELNVGDRVRGTYLKQPFRARVVSVSQPTPGSHYRIALDLNEAVDVVTFDSFSSFRKRVHGQIDSCGVSPARTSDGEPHLVIEGHIHD